MCVIYLFTYTSIHLSIYLFTYTSIHTCIHKFFMTWMSIVCVTIWTQALKANILQALVATPPFTMPTVMKSMKATKKATAPAPKAMKAMNKDNVFFIMASLGKLVLLKYG